MPVPSLASRSALDMLFTYTLGPRFDVIDLQGAFGDDRAIGLSIHVKEVGNG